MDQPHILVTGDAWQYVPFGRARLKSLRATGLSYASQSYTVDGATIKVRIVGDQSFIQIDGDPTLYCESGQLEWPFRPLYSPLWGEAATWKFMDIPTTSKYLGKVKVGKEGRGDQVNTPKLSNGMRSKAVGWPLGDGDPTDDEIQETYSGHTITKKRAMSWFPASVFSGKMRLFMQSIYGAKEPEPGKEYFPISVDDDPQMLIFHSSLEGGATLMARSNSMGIFTAPDDTYWLLDINEGEGRALVNRIDTAKATTLVKQLKNMSADERAKAEAYIFANSKIEIPKVADTVYTQGHFTMPPGGQIAYGWKWNTSGNRASMVVHETLGESIPETRWHARTVHLTFTYTAKTDTTPAVISVSGTVEDHSDWIDGWGETNIFVPLEPNKYSPLLLHSLRAGSGLIPPIIEFPPTPIYGYYVNDAWSPVMLSNGDKDPTTVTNSSASGVTYPFGESAPQHSEQPWVGGSVDGNISHGYTWLTSTDNPTYSINFDGFSRSSGNKVVNGENYTQTASGNDDNTPLAAFEWTGTWVSSDGGDSLPPSTTFSTVKAGAPPVVLYARQAWGHITTVNITTVGNVGKKFVVVVPGGDAEALYVATYEAQTAGDVETTVVSYQQVGSIYFWIDLDPVEVHVPLGNGAQWTEVKRVQIPEGQQDSWNPDGFSTQYGPPTTVSTETLERKVEVNVYCFNRKVHGVEGKPGGSYNGLFDCNYQYPQYDRGMFTYTSYGGRYIMSEAPSNPTSITWHNFVGWA